MQEIIKAVEKLNELMPGWRSWYVNNEYEEENYNREEIFILRDIVEMVRRKEEQFMDHPDEEEEKKWQEGIQNLIGREVYEKTIDSWQSAFSIYSDMKVIRDMGENAFHFLTDAIYYYSAFYDTSFLEQNERYGIEDRVLFEKAVRALDTVIYAHADRHFTKQMAKQEFEDVTGIREPYSSCYAERYEKYFDTIRGNCCMDLLHKLNNKLNYLIQKLDDDQ